MRVAQLFKRVLGLGRVRIVAVRWHEGASGRAIEVEVALPARRLRRCGGCGRPANAVHDHRTRRWRHLDLARTRLVLVCRLARVACPSCGVAEERVPWARAGARFTRAFEDTCAWLARQAPQSVVARLLGLDWETVGRIAGRLVAEQRAGHDGLGGLRRIGIDEVSWARGHRYLTVVACHDSGRVVWCGAGEPGAALERFFGELGQQRAALIEAISLDLAPRFLAVAAHHCPRAAICADPFHLVAAAHFALDRLRAAEWQRLRREDPAGARWLKGARWALRRAPARRRDADRALIERLEEANRSVYRAHLWCDQLRATLAGRDPEIARAELALLAEDARSLGHPRFTRMAGRLTRHAEQILNTIRHGISNGRIEALNSTVRLLSHRARGFRRVDNLIALIHLVCGRVHVELPT
jgi:transposase